MIWHSSCMCMPVLVYNADDHNKTQAFTLHLSSYHSTNSSQKPLRNGTLFQTMNTCTCKVFWKSNSICNSADIMNKQLKKFPILCLQKHCISKQQTIPSLAESLLPSFATAQTIPALAPPPSHLTTSSSLQCCFAPAKTDADIDKARSGISKKDFGRY